MPTELEVVFLNEQPSTIDTEVIEAQLRQTLHRLTASVEKSPLRQSDEVGRLITEIVFVGDKKITALNAQFRGVNAPTDVLSFERSEANPNYPASIVISVETAERQAKIAGWSISQELVSLANHGFLHVLGFSHT